MDWREEMKQQHRKTIDEMRESIKKMDAGTLEMRRVENGSWAVVNDAMIACGIKTIETLDEIISNAEAAVRAEKTDKHD